MRRTEKEWDQILGISTCGRDDKNADDYRFPYEPTPYSVLERLADSGYIGGEDVILDYGCGKGRVGFFLSHMTGAKTIGVEYDNRIFAEALENKETAAVKTGAEFINTRAESYSVPATVTRCYFFNPFSVEILHKVLARILDSYYDNPREILLFFYYPSDEYIAKLMTVDALSFADEIECDDLFLENRARERILLFSLS